MRHLERRHHDDSRNNTADDNVTDNYGGNAREDYDGAADAYDNCAAPRAAAVYRVVRRLPIVHETTHICTRCSRLPMAANASALPHGATCAHPTLPPQ